MSGISPGEKEPTTGAQERKPRPQARGGPLPQSDEEFLRDLPRQGGARHVGPVRLEARISRGGMGVVYRGRHLKLDIDVAVKFLLPHLAEKNPEYVLRFEREARFAAQLNNENLVRVFDVDSENNYHYVVMELVCGETARDRVARKGPLAEAEAMAIVLGATRGLDAAHRKSIIHRDIKPENIMIDASGVVKVADLGIAKVQTASDRTQSLVTQPGVIIGTPSFMAPEQVQSAHGVTPAVDIYSMGATLYFLLTGKPPFEGNLFQIIQAIGHRGFPDVRKERPHLSETTLRILRRCTALDPRARYPDAGALLRDLERCVPRRTNLAEAEMGTVSAEARVSTPPRQRLGEIRLQAEGDSGGVEAPPGSGDRRRRMAVVLLSILLLSGSCTVGGYFAIREFLGSPASASSKAAGTGAQAMGASTTSVEVEPRPGRGPDAPESSKGEVEHSPSSRERLLDLLRAEPPRQADAVVLLGSLCAEGGSRVPGSPCELGHRAVLDYLRGLPRQGAELEEVEARIAFLRALPEPPEELAPLPASLAEEMKRLLSIYLALAAKTAASKLEAGEWSRSRGCVEAALRLVSGSKVEKALAAEVEQLLLLKQRSLEAEAAAKAAREAEPPRKAKAAAVVEAPSTSPARAPTPEKAPASPAEPPAAAMAASAAGAGSGEPRALEEPEPALPWARGLVSDFQTEGAQAAGMPVALEFRLEDEALLRLVFIPAGELRRTAGPEGPDQKVTITKDFYLGINEVTWSLYTAVTGSRPRVGAAVSGEEVGQLPVTGVSWEDANRFCAALNEMVAEGGGTARFRLPTEAEWEYACRAGTTTPFPWGAQLDDRHVWYWMNSNQRPHAVGMKKPNPWGLFDMLGNVNEWCADWYAPYPPGAAVDPAGPPGGTARVFRGGSYKNLKAQVSPVRRRHLPPGRSDGEIGFRLVMEP